MLPSWLLPVSGAGLARPLVTIYLVWGSTFIALAITVRDLPPLLSMAIRHLFAGALLLAWALPRGDKGRATGSRARRSSPASSSEACSSSSATAASRGRSKTVPAGVAALLVKGIPIWMALLDRVVFGKRLRSSAYVGFVLGFVGLAFLFDPFGEGHVDRVGALVIVFGAHSPGRRGPLLARAALPRRPLVSAGLGALCGGSSSSSPSGAGSSARRPQPADSLLAVTPT